MDQVIDLAQTFQRGLRLRDTQIQGLNEAVAGRDHTIAQFELQVLEHGAEIVQRNTVIGFLQGQVHELQANLDDAMAHIGMLHEQPIPSVVPAEPATAEDQEVFEGVSDLDSEHALAEPNPQPDDSPPAVLPLWATSTTSRHLRLVLDSLCFSCCSICT